MPSPTSCGFRRPLFATYARICAAVNNPLPADNAPVLNLRSVSSECTVQARRPLSSFESRVEWLPIRTVIQVILVTGELSERSSVLKVERHEHLVWLTRT